MKYFRLEADVVTIMPMEEDCSGTLSSGLFTGRTKVSKRQRKIQKSIEKNRLEENILSG